MDLIDTHCHVSYPDFDRDRDAVLARAKDAGVACMITVATDPSCWQRYLDLSEGRPQVRVALGFHPNYADTYSAEAFADLRARIEKNRDRVVAVGETGLDFFRDSCAPELQARAFQAQLDLAAELDLPFILHCRKAEREMLDVLAAQRKRLGALRGVWHCFSASVAHMKEAVDLGLYLGFGGILTYPKAQEVRDAAQAAPAERLLLETDAPYLPPQPWRGQRNEPAYVAETARRLAEVRGVPPDELAQTTSANARALFRL
ncbi:MAG: TatD family hydrolase [Planctomycetota bacterium]|nr:TatD family hydrolase [Planctomycetota bacterium]